MLCCTHPDSDHKGKTPGEHTLPSSHKQIDRDEPFQSAMHCNNRARFVWSTVFPSAVCCLDLMPSRTAHVFLRVREHWLACSPVHGVKLKPHRKDGDEASPKPLQQHNGLGSLQWTLADCVKTMLRMQTMTSLLPQAMHTAPLWFHSTRCDKQSDRDEASQNAARCCNNDRFVFLCYKRFEYVHHATPA